MRGLRRGADLVTRAVAGGRSRVPGAIREEHPQHQHLIPCRAHAAKSRHAQIWLHIAPESLSTPLGASQRHQPRDSARPQSLQRASERSARPHTGQRSPESTAAETTTVQTRLHDHLIPRTQPEAHRPECRTNPAVTRRVERDRAQPTRSYTAFCLPQMIFNISNHRTRVGTAEPPAPPAPNAIRQPRR